MSDGAQHDVRQAERQDLRLCILQVVYAGDDQYCFSGELLAKELGKLAVTARLEEIKRACRYLSLQGLLQITGAVDPVYCLTAAGVDLCEGNLPVPLGISPLNDLTG